MEGTYIAFSQERSHGRGKLPLIIANINYTNISPWFGYISREGGEGRGELIAKCVLHVCKNLLIFIV